MGQEEDRDMLIRIDQQLTDMKKDWEEFKLEVRQDIRGLTKVMNKKPCQTIEEKVRTHGRIIWTAFGASVIAMVKTIWDIVTGG